MARTRRLLLTVGFALTLASAICPRDSAAAEFNAEAAALPFPPDARELEFVAWAGHIKYNSQSPLKSLAAFYLKEMAVRGWEHDESAAKIEKDSIKLTFKQGEARVDLHVSQWSKEVRVRMDCKGLKFTDTDDPSKLAAAGIPVPRATLYLQKEVPLPAGVQDVQYGGDNCTLKSSMKLQEAFDYFAGLIKSKGFRESRRPIISDTRRYTEFQQGSVEVSVNVFAHEVGSRIVLNYEDRQNETPVPPLPAVATLPLMNAGKADEPAADEIAPASVAKTPIDVTRNKGSASVTYGGSEYTFTNAACFQTKDRGSHATMVVFSAKPIPFNKMQSTASTKDDFSFGELYDLDSPDHLVLELGEHLSFAFSVPGVSIGHPVKESVNEMKVEAGRVRGTLKMVPEEILSRQFSFTATVDAAVITPNTRIAGPGDAVERSDHPILADSPVPMPEGSQDVSRKGSKFRKTYSAVVAMPPADVASFYRKELAAKGWKRADTDAAGEAMQFQNDTMELSVAIKRQGGQTAIEVVTREVALARREGILPQPGKSRLVLANAHNVDVVYTIGETDYPLKAGHGAKDFKEALNYSVAPGTYEVVVKIPGQQQQTERIGLTEGSTWAIIALPTGGYLPMQLY